MCFHLILMFYIVNFVIVLFGEISLHAIHFDNSVTCVQMRRHV